MTQALSIVIPTRDRPDTLVRCLAHVRGQRALDTVAEVIVVDDGSGPETAAALDAVAPGYPVPLVRLRHDEAHGPAAARNRGIARASAPATLLLDDDVLLAPGALAALVAAGLPLGSAGPSLLGHVTWHPEEVVTPFMWWQEHGGAQFAFDAIADPERAGWRFFGTSCVAANTNLLQRVPFDERFRIARYEDMELGYRLERHHRSRLRYLPQVVGWHVHRTTLLDWLARVPAFAAPAIHFADAAGDPAVAVAIGVAGARRLDRFRWAHVSRAADLVLALEPEVRVPPVATAVFGELWAWECVAPAYRMLQHFFFVTALREGLGLAPAEASDAPLDAGGACRVLLARLSGAPACGEGRRGRPGLADVLEALG